MGQKLRTMVMKRAALCDLVAGAAQVQGPGVGGSLGEYLAPALCDGESLPDLELPIRLYGRRLLGFRDQMVQADAEYLQQLALLADLRRQSEAPMAKLKGSILSLRSTCEGLLGTESLGSLALDFNLAQEPRGVLRQGEIIQERLLSSEVELVPRRWVKATLDREEVANELDGEIVDLRVMVERLVAQRKVVDTAKVRKDEAMKEFDRQFIPLARMLEATFRLAGETDLADRIRPTVRQLGRDDGQGEDDAESEARAPESTPASESGAVEETVSSAS